MSRNLRRPGLGILRRGHHQHLQVQPLVMDPLGEVPAIHDPHAHIEQDDLQPTPLHLLERFQPIGGGMDRIALEFQSEVKRYQPVEAMLPAGIWGEREALASGPSAGTAPHSRATSVSS